MTGKTEAARTTTGKAVAGTSRADARYRPGGVAGSHAWDSGSIRDFHPGGHIPRTNG